MRPPTENRRTALITGGSSGIGAAFAHEFARRGFRVVLVARGAERLRATAEAIAAETGAETVTIQADLSDPAAPERIAAEINARGLTVDALVNNAGFGAPGELADTPWPRHAACLQVMVTAPVRLTSLFAPGMAARRRGWIVNVSSLSAFLPPHAGGTLYYPVKSFLLQFSLAMREELRPRGVHVTALCPGFTATNFQAAAGGTVESVQMPRWTWLTADRVAREGVDAVMRGKAVHIPGFINRLIALLFKLAPGALGRWLARGRS